MASTDYETAVGKKIHFDSTENRPINKKHQRSFFFLEKNGDVFFMGTLPICAVESILLNCADLVALVSID
jgi:hypothetical protein